MPAVGLTGAATVTAETTNAPTPAPEKVFLEVNRTAAIAIEKACEADHHVAPNDFRIEVLARRSDLRDPDAKDVDVRYDDCSTITLRREDIVAFQLAKGRP